MTFQNLLQVSPYDLPQGQKEDYLLEQLDELCMHHRQHCPEYDRLISTLHPGFCRANALSEIPYLPVSLFKTHKLQSVAGSKVFKTLVSSGTTGQQVSQIVLDRETAQRQTLALSRIMTQLLGPDRLPMIIVDAPGLLRDRARFSARAAGVVGMMNFGRNHFFALDDEMNLDTKGLAAFLDKWGTQPFFVFGFTFMVWKYFFQRIEKLQFDLSCGTLLHGGGWKKMKELAVEHAIFKSRLAECSGLSRVYNFYGLVEQVGSIYVEGDDGYLYAPNFAEIIVRDPQTWREAEIGKPGVIQLLSVVPLSYPGHSILTEDIGVVHGVDDSVSGRKGKYFSVIGRVQESELRGCSDVYAMSDGLYAMSGSL